MRMEGKRGLVTGAASGLGREVTRLFAAEGARVAAADLNGEGVEAVAAEIRESGGEAIHEACDVTAEDQVIAALERVVREWGGIDYVVNNAGVQVEKPLHETTNEEYDFLFDVNVRAVFWGCKHGVARLRESGGGAIVNTASALSLISDPFLPVYTASKHAVLGLTRSVGVAYAAEGIRCNCVCPGDMQTPMIERYWEATGDPEKARAEMASMYPAGKIGQPGEVAQVILFLASEEASYVNASFLQVDGGLLSKVY
jgi:NAD(P)-dependent dehydrogenase (short-subunit alcohol dehydrogenase family)